MPPAIPMLNKDFKEFVGLLDSTNVEYLLVGACRSTRATPADAG
jgi:hypothetical protein